MKDDEPPMLIRITEYPPPRYEMALKVFADTVKKQGAYVKELESQVGTE